MIYPGNLKVSTPNDREIELTRDFDAPRRLVFDALTKPELLKRWFHGPPGWTMVVCDFNLAVGGTYRYVWRSEADGMEMGMGGTILAFTVPERIVSTERFDESWYAGDAVDTMVLADHGERTNLTITVRYDSREIRDAVLKSPMADGMAAGYERLAEFLATEMAQETP